MADKDSAWWERQAGQYKAELDQLNPQLNVANARVAELEAKLTLAEQAETATRLQAANVQSEWHRLAEETKAIIAERDANAIALRDAYAELTRLRNALAKKNAALAPCLAGVAQQLDLIKTAIEAE